MHKRWRVWSIFDFWAFAVFMQFNPQDMWTICSAGKLPSDAKAIWQTQLNRLCPALMWCPPCFRYWHTGRLRVVGALCSVHSVHCNIMYCIFWFAYTHCNILQYVCVRTVHTVVKCISCIIYSLQYHALLKWDWHTVQQCSTDVCIVYTFHSSGQN